MRVAPAPLSAEPPLRSVTTAPKSVTGACILLLATLNNAPIGSLRLQTESQFASHASSLRLPAANDATPEERGDIATQLLWHAARDVPTLRSGGALLARPKTTDDAATLSSLGFAPASAEDDALLALVRRREPTEVLSYSHTALRVSDIERSLDFWSLLHFAPSRLFTTSGARAAWLAAAWTPLAIELIEVPAIMLRQTPPERLKPSDEALGPSHLVLDVTTLGVTLPSTAAIKPEARPDSSCLAVAGGHGAFPAAAYPAAAGGCWPLPRAVD